jgi:hypothetical protein
VGRYETDGLKFFASKPEYHKGPSYIVDMWKEFTCGMTL